MKILTRYILIEFSKPFLLGLFGLSVLFLVAQVFNEMRLILEHKPGILIALKYFLFKLPSLTIQIVPIAVLFAVLFSLARLAKSSELVAMRAGGVSIFLVAVPLFFSGLIVCGLTFCANEWLIPKTAKITRHTKDVEILKQPEPTMNLIRQNISLVGSNSQIFHIDSFDGSTNVMTEVLILEFAGESKLKSRMDARKARWENGQWVFYDGYYRVFDDAQNEVSAKPFDRLPVALTETPSDFLKEQKLPEELNFTELAAYIIQLKRNGSDYHKELVQLHYKLAVPFGCVIMAILGVPWGWNMGKYSGVVLSFLICFLMVVLYVGGLQVGQQLGNSGQLSPFFSMWSLNILFCIGIPPLLIRKNR